ncbi:MAG TPA: alpha/beta hydrolase [Puia sp.]|nr:alpha/beta hydrolase [Puia sp.]
MYTNNQNRRHFLGTAALTLAAAPFGLLGDVITPFGMEGTTPSKRNSAGANGSFGPLKQINAGVLTVGYVDAGPTDGPVVLLLHGWPYDIHSYAEVAPLLTAKGYRVVVPYVRGCGTTQFLSAGTFRTGQPSAVAQDVIDLMDALKIEKAVIGGFDWGGRSANIVAALWPKRCKAMVSVSGYLVSGVAANKLPLPPSAEYQWWYQFYFATERGALGYDKYRHDFGKLIWKIASPKWAFDDATFQRTAESFENPDYAAIVIHNYRFRLGLVDGEAKYADLEARLAKLPEITVPTITLEGDANGAPHYPDDSSYRKRFTGKYANRVITGGIGHNLPQEAPAAFAQAIIDVDRF